MSATSSPRIAIVGGGPAGLVVLLTLTKRGIPATLYEREVSSSSRAYLGGMLDLEWETGQRALRENGLEDAFRKYSRRDAEETKICGKAGVPLFHREEPQVDPLTADLRHARPEIDRRVLREMMLDAVLREMMLDAVPQDAVKWGYALASIRPLEGGQHELTFANGTTAVADFVVGADGANSRVRSLVSPAVLIYYGLTSVELSLAPAVAALPENRDISDGVGKGSCYITEDEKFIAMQRNGDGRIRAYLSHLNKLDWTLPRDPKEAKEVVLGIFHDWAPWIRRFIEQADEDAIYVRPYLYLPVGHRWEHKDGVTVIGDAAHLMGPFAGAGANLAMGDGVELGLVLADAVSKGLSREEREAAVAAWEEGMFARGEKFAALTLKNFKNILDHEAPQSTIRAFQAAIAHGA